MANNYEIKQSAILQMEIDYLREKIETLQAENKQLQERINKRKRTHGTKVYSIIIKSEEHGKVQNR